MQSHLLKSGKYNEPNCGRSRDNKHRCLGFREFDERQRTVYILSSNVTRLSTSCVRYYTYGATFWTYIYDACFVRRAEYRLLTGKFSGIHGTGRCATVRIEFRNFIASHEGSVIRERYVMHINADELDAQKGRNAFPCSLFSPQIKFIITM